MTTPHPIILCGKTEAIGAVVVESLKPEIETIEFIQSVEVGKKRIPALLRGERVDCGAGSSKLGTRDYDRIPVAVVLGAAFDDQGIVELRDAARVEGARDVPWLRPDARKPMPPPGPAYGEAMVERIKVRVKELEERGELGNGGLVWF